MKIVVIGRSRWRVQMQERAKRARDEVAWAPVAAAASRRANRHAGAGAHLAWRRRCAR